MREGGQGTEEGKEQKELVEVEESEKEREVARPGALRQGEVVGLVGCARE